MKTATPAALILVSTAAAAHPGHGGKGWVHKHQDALVDAAMIAGACLVAVLFVRLLWKLVSRP